MYHSVSPYESTLEKLRVSPDTFERQMHFLKSHHYNVISLESLGNLIRQKKKIPPKTAVITLDDGYKDNYIYAFPILKKYNLPATVFIIVNEVARSQGDRLSWDEIKEMLNSGLISIGSHCLGPEPLTNIKSEEILRKEIFDSKKVLEAKLGTKINTFAYPEGRFNDKIKKLVSKAGYTVAVATSPGKKFSDNDLFALKRLRISENAANLFVFWVKLTGYYNFMREHRHK
jgi:peptidoglycan/xylan/chitin deacetylase (PgdA/CDA1 family)